MRRAALTSAALLVLLQACTMGPDFVAPKPDTPDAWTKAALQPTANAQPSRAVVAPVPDAWWTSFNDSVLTSLIARARTSNLDLRQSVLRIAEARAQRDIAAAGQWPSLSANTGYTRQRISERTAFTSLIGGLSGGHSVAAGGSASGPVGGVSGASPSLTNPFDLYQWGFDASWEIDLFGRVRRGIEAADADTEAATEDSRDVILSLDGDVARAYIDLRAAQRRQTILTADLDSERQILALTRDRARFGIGNDVDVANAAAQVASTEAEIAPVATLVSQSINRLSLLLALQPGALRSELDGARPVPPVPPQVPVGLPAELARRRPDIRRAEARLHAATARIGVAVADLFPRLTLNAAAGIEASRFADLSSWAGRFFSLGPSLEIPIFSGGGRQATVRLSDAEAQEAAIAYAATVLGALHEVENALTAYGEEQSRRNALEAAVAQNETALALSRERYRSGVETFLAVLDAERSLQQSELALADSTAAVSTDLIVLYKALGGGWRARTTDDGATSPKESAPIPDRGR